MDIDWMTLALTFLFVSLASCCGTLLAYFLVGWMTKGTQ